MSIPEKLKTVDENVPAVYESGKKSMIDESKLLPTTVSGSYISVDDVSEVPHNVTCKVDSVNLLRGLASGEANGLVWTANGDGSITISGTATETTTIKSTYISVPSGQYFISGIPKEINEAAGATFLYLQVNYDTNTTTGAFGGRDGGSGASFLVPDNSKQIKPYIGVYKGLTLDGVTIHPMINRGDTSLPYTPYVSPETVQMIKYGKDKSEGYKTLTPNADGTVDGMTSVSPYMNIFSDTDGVNIEVTYNKSWGMQEAQERFCDAFSQEAIDNSISFERLTLTKESIASIINALSPTVTGQTVTFKKSAKEAAFTDDEWAELTAAKPNWTFSLL